MQVNLIKRFVVCAIVAIAVVSTTASAEDRGCTVTLAAGQFEQLELEPFFVADICLAGGEKIAKYLPGNVRAWEWATFGSQRLIVRAAAAGERTNLLVYGEGDNPARFELLLVVKSGK